MKTWKLVLIQLWVLSYMPVWLFILIFAPMAIFTAPPDKMLLVLLLFVSPPVVLIACSIALWLARSKGNERLVKRLAISMIFLPPIMTVPLFLWQ